MSSNKHILLVTPGFPEDEADTTCIPVLQDLVKGLADGGEVDLKVLSIHYPFASKGYDWHGVPVFAGGGANRGFPGRLWVWRRILRRIRGWHRERPFDRVHAFWLSEAAWLGQRMASRWELPCSVTLMGQEFEGKNRYLNKLDLDSLELVSISPRMSKRCQEVLDRKPKHLIPWGISTEEFSPVSEKKIDVLGVGNLTPLKNYEAWLETLALLKELRPEFRAVLVGEGPEHPKLIRLRDKLGLRDRVEFAGKRTHPEVLELMRKSRFFLHTSRWESYGAVLNEAIASGMVVVSAPVGIAENGPRMKTGTSSEEWVRLLHAYWDAESFPPQSPISLTSTLDGYRALFMD